LPDAPVSDLRTALQTLPESLSRWGELYPRAREATETVKGIKRRTEWLAHDNGLDPDGAEARTSRLAADVRQRFEPELRITEDYQAFVEALRRDARVVAAEAEKAGIDAGPLLLFAEELGANHADAALRLEEARAVAARASVLLDAATAPHAPRVTKPKWDADNKTLIWIVPIKTYKAGAAANQVELLDAFEAAGWGRCIPDPFNDSQKLNQTLKDLRKHLPLGTITFSADGDGGVRWEPAATL
jgi:hypothetical protein